MPRQQPENNEATTSGNSETKKKMEAKCSLCKEQYNMLDSFKEHTRKSKLHILKAQQLKEINSITLEQYREEDGSPEIYEVTESTGTAENQQYIIMLTTFLAVRFALYGNKNFKISVNNNSWKDFGNIVLEVNDSGRTEIGAVRCTRVETKSVYKTDVLKSESGNLSLKEHCEIMEKMRLVTLKPKILCDEISKLINPGFEKLELIKLKLKRLKLATEYGLESLALSELKGLKSDLEFEKWGTDLENLKLALNSDNLKLAQVKLESINSVIDLKLWNEFLTNLEDNLNCDDSSSLSHLKELKCALNKNDFRSTKSILKKLKLELRPELWNADLEKLESALELKNSKLAEPELEKLKSQLGKLKSMLESDKWGSILNNLESSLAPEKLNKMKLDLDTLKSALESKNYKVGISDLKKLKSNLKSEKWNSELDRLIFALEVENFKTKKAKFEELKSEGKPEGWKPAVENLITGLKSERLKLLKLKSKQLEANVTLENMIELKELLKFDGYTSDLKKLESILELDDFKLAKTELLKLEPDKKKFRLLKIEFKRKEFKMLKLALNWKLNLEKIEALQQNHFNALRSELEEMSSALYNLESTESKLEEMKNILEEDWESIFGKLNTALELEDNQLRQSEMKFLALALEKLESLLEPDNWQPILEELENMTGKKSLELALQRKNFSLAKSYLKQLKSSLGGENLNFDLEDLELALEVENLTEMDLQKVMLGESDVNESLIVKVEKLKNQLLKRNSVLLTKKWKPILDKLESNLNPKKRELKQKSDLNRLKLTLQTGNYKVAYTVFKQLTSELKSENRNSDLDRLMFALEMENFKLKKTNLEELKSECKLNGWKSAVENLKQNKIKSEHLKLFRSKLRELQANLSVETLLNVKLAPELDLYSSDFKNLESVLHLDDFEWAKTEFENLEDSDKNKIERLKTVLGSEEFKTIKLALNWKLNVTKIETLHIKHLKYLKTELKEILFVLDEKNLESVEVCLDKVRLILTYDWEVLKTVLEKLRSDLDKEALERVELSLKKMQPILEQNGKPPLFEEWDSAMELENIQLQKSELEYLESELENLKSALKPKSWKSVLNKLGESPAGELQVALNAKNFNKAKLCLKVLKYWNSDLVILKSALEVENLNLAKLELEKLKSENSEWEKLKFALESDTFKSAYSDLQKLKTVLEESKWKPHLTKLESMLMVKIMKYKLANLELALKSKARNLISSSMNELKSEKSEDVEVSKCINNLEKELKEGNLDQIDLYLEILNSYLNEQLEAMPSIMEPIQNIESMFQEIDFNSVKLEINRLINQYNYHVANFKLYTISSIDFNSKIVYDDKVVSQWEEIENRKLWRDRTLETEQSRKRKEDLFNSTNESDEVYYFKLVPGDYSDFENDLNKFCIYINQKNINELKSSIQNMIEDKFSESPDIFSEVIKYVKQYFKSGSIVRKNYKLLKEDLLLKISELLLAPFLLFPDKPVEERNLELWNSTIQQFDVVVVKLENDIIEKIYQGLDHILISHLDISNKIPEIRDVRNKKLKGKLFNHDGSLKFSYIALWKIGLIPLILKAEDEDAFTKILHVINFLKCKKFSLKFIIATDLPLDHGHFPDLKVFLTLADLELYQNPNLERVLNQKVSILETEVSLSEIYANNDDFLGKLRPDMLLNMLFEEYSFKDIDTPITKDIVSNCFVLQDQYVRNVSQYFENKGKTPEKDILSYLVNVNGSPCCIQVPPQL